MSMRTIQAAGAALLLAVALATLLTSPSARAEVDPTRAAPAPVCPIPSQDAQGSIDVCVDRGERGIYQVDDRITICITVNVPQILIFPPPPPPTIRVVNSVSGGPERTIFETATGSGELCIVATVVSPVGQETIRADVLGDDGSVIASDTTSYVSVDVPPIPLPGPRD